MPRPGAVAESFAGRRTNPSTPARRTRSDTLLLLLTVFAFALPVGMLPVAGASPAAPPAALPLAPHSTGTPALSQGSISLNQAVPGSVGAPGPALTAADRASTLPARLPAPGTENFGQTGTTAASASVNKVTSPAPNAGLTPQYKTAEEAQKARMSLPLPPIAAAGYQTPIGWFTGYVNDTTDRSGIAGMFLQVFSNVQCSTTRCPYTFTNSTGYFNITCPAPGGPGDNDAIVSTLNNWWFDNSTSQTCIANVTRYVGTWYLVRDAAAVATVKDTFGNAIAGVTLEGITRDNVVQVFPQGVTVGNGSLAQPFAIPPTPGIVHLFPPNGYASTFNYTDATPGLGNRPNVPPWLGGVNLGTFYLQRQTLVVAHLIDSQSGGTVTAAAALAACDGFGNGCGTQGPGVSGPNVRAFANPGWNFFEAYAQGYVESTTMAMLIPEEAKGTTYSIGNVYMTELGSFHLEDFLSTPAGGTPPWAAPANGFYTTVCSDTGYYTSIVIPGGWGYGFNMTDSLCASYGCWSKGQSQNIPAPPLRSFVTVFPDTKAFCNPPYPNWPVPSNPPAWENYTYVNITAGHTLSSPNPIIVNLTVGDYVALHVYAQGTTSMPSGGFTVSEQSTDNNYWNVESYVFNTNNTAYGNTPCNSISGSGGTGAACIAVPPGNTKVTVTSNSGNYFSNWTWVHTPDYCCRVSAGPGWPTTLALSTSNHVQSVNLTPSTGQVFGYAIVAGTTSTPVPLITVQSCPAASQSSAACESGLGINGSFFGIPAPAGIDYVTVAAPGYSSNRVWVNVTVGGNISVGVIPMYALGVLDGRVQGPNGTPIYHALVQYCTVGASGPCTGGSLSGINLGPGFTNTQGDYNGTVPGGWLPFASYVVVATSPGYTTDWTFGNASSGNYTTLPTITLLPIGVNGSRPVEASPSHPAAGGSGAAAGAWVTGRLWSNESGGVYVPPGSGLVFCPLSSIVCVPIGDGTNTEGYFNTSLAPGLYYLNITVAGYESLSVFLNLTQAAFYDMGTIYLEGDWWVAGKLVIDPWRSVSLSTGGLYGDGYAPAASIQGCDLGRVNCLPGLPAAVNGSFNVPIPPGPSATIMANPSGTAYGGTVSGGFVSNRTVVFNLTSQNTTLSGTNAYLGLSIYGTVFGKIWNNNTVNDSFNGTWPAYGLPYASVQLTQGGNNTGTVAYTTDGGGVWSFWVPGGNSNNTTKLVLTDTAFDSQSYSVESGLAAGNGSSYAGNHMLRRFGWVQTEFNSTGTGLPVPFVGASTLYINPQTLTPYTTTDSANQAGYLNITTPFGAGVLINVNAPDFNTTNFTIPVVNSSQTTFDNGTSPFNLAWHSLPAWGWVLTSPVNYSNGAKPPLSSLPAPIVRDSVNGLGVPDAQVTVISPDPTVGQGQSGTNWQGMFYSDAPIGPADQLQVTHQGFLTNTTTRLVRSASYTVLTALDPILLIGGLNLTGDSIIAGTVVPDPRVPGETGISGATVQACGTVQNVASCTTVLTNVSGAYWIQAPPGGVTLSISATNFISTTAFMTTCSDCWVNAGNTSLPSYGYVSGTVRGLPSGFPIEGANVSLCSTIGTPVGPCGLGSTTNVFGHFVVSSPPGDYILQVNDTNYNSTYLPVSLSPGETTNVGTLFLDSFGSATGYVYDSSTAAPVGGAAVFGCPTWSGGTCANTVTTNAFGQYTFSQAPGPYTISVIAKGYQTGNGGVTLYPGLTTQAGPILLDPIGGNSAIGVAGKVLDATNSSLGIRGATVSAFACIGQVCSNGSTSSTVTDGKGHFLLSLPYGKYLVQAWANGYQTQSQFVMATGSQPDLTFRMSTQLYRVDGVMLDGLTSQPISGVQIEALSGKTPVILATTDTSGEYSMELANGTHDLTAVGPATSSVDYAPLEFSVVVNGQPMSLNRSMTPAISTVTLMVVDEKTGLPLAGASVSIVGVVEVGYRVKQTYTTGPDGRIVAGLYYGGYSASTSYGGYKALVETFNASSAKTTVTLALAPTVVSTSASMLAGATWAIYGALGLAAAVVVVAVLFAGRPRRGVSAELTPPRSGSSSPPGRSN